MANIATNTRALNALYAVMNANATEVQELTSGEFYKNKQSIFDFLAFLRNKGNFVSTLGLTSVAEGGTVRTSENGRCTIFFRYADGNKSKDGKLVVSEKLSKRMVELGGDTDFRSMPEGGVEALRTMYPLLTKAFAGVHKDTGAFMLAV